MGSPGIELLFIKQTHGVTRLHSAGLLSVADKGVACCKGALQHAQNTQGLFFIRSH